MILIRQRIGEKLNTQERNNSIYILKIRNVLLSENKIVYCKEAYHFGASCKNSVCVLGIGNRLINS